MNQNKVNEMQSSTITVELDGTDPVECAIITVLTVAENDYIFLIPINDKGEDVGDDIWVYRYVEDETHTADNPDLQEVTDPEEFELVAAAFDDYCEKNDLEF
ncbi:MAG: DUF1292 domain-containing protein [Eubacterium sp.]|nr:DUF1292 domain-containing protein [Eubacterium sp.]